VSRATELAERLRTDHRLDSPNDEAADELERLARMNAELVEALREWKEFYDADVEPGESTINKMLAAFTSAKEQQ
jgi:hypothetical protein